MVMESCCALSCRKRLKVLPGAEEVHVIGRSRGCQIVMDQDFVVERQLVHGRTYTQMQAEGTFSQPNGVVCQDMVSWASRVVQGSPGDCLELYCGNGNFTIPMAQHFRRVVATEVRARRRTPPLVAPCCCDTCCDSLRNDSVGIEIVKGYNVGDHEYACMHA
jgi:hypothetical protein